MQRVCLDRVEIDLLTFAETVDHILALTTLPHSRAHQITTVNAQFVGNAHRDSHLAEVIRHAKLSVADGVSLLWASQLLGIPLPGRVNGTDLMVRLCEKAALSGQSIYFLGGHPGSAELAASALSHRCPGLKIVGIDCPPFGFTTNPALDAQACEKIREAKPDIVFVALGMPKAEYWIHSHSDLPAKVMIGVGGSFELVGGVIKRAPALFQNLGCEWLWRLAMEPKRLWKRYLFGNALFVYLVLRQWVRATPSVVAKRDAIDSQTV